MTKVEWVTEGSMRILLSSDNLVKHSLHYREYRAASEDCQVDTSVSCAIHGATLEDRRKSMEQGQVDRGAHLFVPGVTGMKMVARIGGGVEDSRVGGIADGLIEVDDAVEYAAGADPLIDRFAHLLAGR